MAAKEFKSFATFANFLEKTAVRLETITTQAAVLGSFVLFEHIHDTYGDNTKLADLMDSTQTIRQRLGFTPNDPLLRDGGLLRDHEEREALGNVAGVGNTEVISAYHEMGYMNARTGQPVVARPVHKIGLDESEPEVSQLLLDLAKIAMGESVTIKKRG